MTYTFEIDPAQVLGVASDATLEQIREAYRAQSKKYHPDLGGDEWAFRLVSRSYEMLGRARVAGRVSANDASSAPSRRPVEPVTPQEPHPDGASLRSGVRDRVDHPLLLVDVELLLLRLELENPYEVIALPASDRNLSCNLNVSWPSALATDAGPGPDRSEIHARVAEAFAAALAQARPSSTWQDEGSSAFRGWQSFPTAQSCYGGFNLLRQELKQRGLGVNQRIREIVIPRASD